MIGLAVIAGVSVLIGIGLYFYSQLAAERECGDS